MFFLLFFNSHRYAVFCDNVDKIDDVNSNKENTWTAGINKFADLTPEDMKKMGYIGGVLPKET